jgi:radical SAM protein with 4Fe4S-binding SPASM domain
MITDQLPEMEQIFLHGIGEPLLNREIFEIIGYLKERDVCVRFNSNGILLNDQRQRGLIRAGLDELRISLDASSTQGYRKTRNSDNFERIVENLRSFIGLQKRQQVSHPKLSLWFLGTRENISELPDFIKLAAAIGIEEAYLQRLVYFQDDKGYGLAKNSMTLQDSKDEFSALIEQSQDVAARLGIQFTASGLSQPSASVQGQAAAGLPWTRCIRPSTLMYITANGNVLPCCISPFSTVAYASIILGNVFKDSLVEIWSGSRYRHFRKQHQTETPPKCCQGCGVYWSL